MIKHELKVFCACIYYISAPKGIAINQQYFYSILASDYITALKTHSTNMLSTPVSSRSSPHRQPLEVLLSPQSGPRKRIHKRLSTGVTLAQQSPDLPEVGENELRSSRQRRHSRNFSSISHLSKNASAHIDDLSETRSNVRWSKDQLLQHYSQCMKLSQENKINHKNAFDLQLIEHMGEMLRQDGDLNFRLAGGTIFAGAKIYASRVDAIHSEIYRVLSSLGSGEKDEDQEIEDPTDDAGKKMRKRKKNSKILETNEANLRVSLINSSAPTDLMGRIRGSAIDAASCDSVMANQAQLCDDEAMLQFDSKAKSNITNTLKIPENETASLSVYQSIATAVSNPPPIATCDSLKEMDFNANTFDVDFPIGKASLDKSNESQNEVGSEGQLDDFGDAASDCGDYPAECNIGDESVFQTQSQLTNVNQNKAAEITDALDVAQWVAVAPPGEYSYFKPNVLSVFDGPGHWLRHKSARSASATAAGANNSQATDASQPKKRKTSEKPTKKKFKNGRIVPDKRLQPQKISKPKMESLRANMKDQILLESSDFNCESILRAMEVKVVLRHFTPDMINKVTMTDEDGVSNFNYNNDDYCPATVDSDYDDQADSSHDLFTNTSEAFFPDFTQNVTSTSPLTDPTEGSDYSALLEGDHLIAHPRKVERIQVQFAKRAKRIDVRRLKSAMWSLIDVEKSQDKSVGVAPREENPPEDADTPANETVDKTTGEVPDAEVVDKGKHLFSEMYRKLPENLSQTMSENLSVPLAFTCLLHLANEKQLKIEGMPTLSDLKISQGL